MLLAKLILLKLKLSSFLKREDGATAIEYAIIAGLIAVAIITTVGLLGDQIEIVFDKIKEALVEANKKG